MGTVIPAPCEHRLARPNLCNQALDYDAIEVHRLLNVAFCLFLNNSLFIRPHRTFSLVVVASWAIPPLEPRAVWAG
jgi:hypothetical protein